LPSLFARLAPDIPANPNKPKPSSQRVVGSGTEAAASFTSQKPALDRGNFKSTHAASGNYEPVAEEVWG
jgi:hypothetical protein